MKFMNMGSNNIAAVTATVTRANLPQRQYKSSSSTHTTAALKGSISRPVLRYSILSLLSCACISTCSAGINSWWAVHFTSGNRDTKKYAQLAFVPSLGSLHDDRATSNLVRKKRRTPLPRGTIAFSSPLPMPSIPSQSRLLSSSSENETPQTKGKRGRRRQSEEDDDAEFEILVSSFKMYKAAYGDLKVPSRFVVPEMPPWPESAWGLKLGQRVAAIRSTERYVENNPSRRATLDSLGFLWRLRSPNSDKSTSDVTFDQIYDALVCYRSEVQQYGPLAVPSSFVVPDAEPWPETTRGMPLGKKIPNVRSAAYLKKNEGSRERLEGIGFQFDGKVAANDIKFNAVFNALVRYKKLNGDLLVPQPFVVPTDGDDAKDWEEEMWGLKLGARVNAIRNQGTFIKKNPERKQMLVDLGFEFDLPKEGKKRGRKRKADVAEEETQGILTEETNGTAVTLSSSQEEIKPSDDNISEQPASVDLFETPAAASTFDDDFFRIRDDEKRAPTWAFEDEEVEQLAALKQQAAEEEYRPPKTLDQTLNAAAEMAMDVGVLQSYGQEKRVVKGKINKRFPWFNDDFGDDFVFEDVVDALRIYKDINGSWDGLDNDEFIVPPPPHLDQNFDPDDPSSPLVDKLDSEMDLENIDDIDLDMDPDEYFADQASMNESRRLKELETLSLQHPWPESLADLRLGHITRRIRDGSLEVKHLPDRRAALDELSFDWGPPERHLDIPFEKAMCAMFGYYLIRGDLFVPHDFVIPDDEPWPSALADYPLGEVVARYRELQNFFEAYHTEKVRLLRRVEFVWFPEMALPLRPEDGDATWEDVVVEGAGHPFFQVNEPTVESIEELRERGQVGDGEEGRNKDWYDYNVVREYWEAGDINGTGKKRTGPAPIWKPAQWLLLNGFEQLSREHEERYGVDNSLELIRTMQDFVDGNMTQEEFDEKTKEIFQAFRYDQLRRDAVQAGYDIDPDQDAESIIQMIKDDINEDDLKILNDPDFQRLVDEEIALREKQSLFSVDEVEDEEPVSTVMEEEIDDEFEEYDEDDLEYRDEDNDDDEGDDEEEEEEEEEDDDDDQYEGEEEDFSLVEEEL